MKADTITKDYISDTTVFADVFNFYVYGGDQVIRPEQLEERDPTEIALPYGTDGAAVPVQKFRDAQKLYAAMTDGDLEYVLYGIENQAEIHYAGPVKNGLYDMLEYAGQVEEAARSHRRAMKSEASHHMAKEKVNTDSSVEQRKPNAGEFLSGFWKTDHLVPSVTVMIYFAPDAWDGPLSLFDMMEVKDPRIFSFIDNYHVRLIAPAQMSDEEIMKFQSSLREVMFFIKYSKDRENLNRILKANEKRFRDLERRAVNVIEAITNSGLKFDESEEAVDVCQAIQEMRMESERKKAQEIAKNFYEMGMDVEKIAQGVGYAVETVKEWLGLSEG